MQRVFHTATLLLPLVLVVLLAAGCGSESSTATATPPTGSGAGSRTLIGPVAGSQALIALATDGRQMHAFVCDGTPDRDAQWWGWFAGAVTGGSFDLTNPQGGHLTGTLTADGATGSVQVAGQSPATFTATPAGPQGGLFRGEATNGSAHYVGGWIVSSTGEQRGAALQDATVTPRRVPALGNGRRAVADTKLV